MENGSAMIEIAWPRAGKWHFFYADKGNLCFDDHVIIIKCLFNCKNDSK